jgi:hypothetical protein
MVQVELGGHCAGLGVYVVTEAADEGAEVVWETVMNLMVRRLQ